MIPFTFDVIALIIDNVNDRGTLFSLLTVGKNVFRHACVVLYRDPFSFLNDEPSTEATLDRRMSLLRLLISLSPAAGSDMDHLRVAFGLQVNDISKVGIPHTMTIDYLSFVKYLRWEGALEHVLPILEDTAYQDWQPTPGRLEDRKSFIRGRITWSLCSHRPDQIRELEIEPEEIERYIAIVSQLYQLRTIVIAAFYCTEDNIPEHTYASAVHLVEALQEHHGQGNVHDCRFSHPKEYGRNSNVFQWDLAIRQLLPLSLPCDLQLAQPLRPMDSYLSRLTTLKTFYDGQHLWEEIGNEYSDMPEGKMIQRCRSLVELHLRFIGDMVDYCSLLAWAADEAQARASGTLLAPAVPLEILHLQLARIPAKDALNVLKDSLCGFSSSLRVLRVSFWELAETEETPSLNLLPEVSFVMKRLCRFMYDSPYPTLFDYRLLQLCPRLTELFIDLDDTQNWRPLPPSWPMLDLPGLTSLTLRGTGISLFDPASLHGMPKLEDLTLSVVWSRPIVPKRQVLWRRWTWDWNLPELKNLNVEMDSSVATFSFKVLQGCPKLTWLTVRISMYENAPPYPLDVALALTNPTQDVFPNMQQLSLVGNFSLQPNDLKVLMGRALPGLDRFDLGNVKQGTLPQVLESIRLHTCLRRVMVGHERLSEAQQQEMGLLKDHTGGLVIGGHNYSFRQV